jgi:glycosyltransferase involved in cell wall biosynthesis
MTGWKMVSHLDWAPKWAEAMEYFDDVVVYDPASFEAVEPLVPAEKLYRVMGGYDADSWKPRPAPRTEMPYRFGMLGVLGARKGPMTALLSWMMLKQKYGEGFNAELHLWSNAPVITVGTRLPEGVYVNHGYWLPEQVQQYYYGLDTLLCPSIAEGKTLPAVEAIASATNVILSDIPAHRAWCDPSMATFVPIEKEIIPLEGYVGDQVSTEALADAMWDAYQNRSRYAERARQASRQIPAMMDWSKCVERLSLTLKLGL